MDLKEEDWVETNFLDLILDCSDLCAEVIISSVERSSEDLFAAVQSTSVASFKIRPFRHLESVASRFFLGWRREEERSPNPLRPLARPLASGKMFTTSLDFQALRMQKYGRGQAAAK